MKEKNLPNHVVIVPDGNRRWARQRDLEPWDGHEEGARKFEEITREALNLGIKHLTFWGSSRDNMTKRPIEERRALLRIYEEYFSRLLESREVFEKSCRINVVGRWAEQFPEKLTELLKDGIEKTKKHAKYFLNFLLAYNGDDDVLEAAGKIMKKALEKGEKLKITPELFQKNLISAALPKVDLIIRTGVENDPHNSAGLLMWQTQNSQYYFSDKMFPDFGAEGFKEAVEDFSKRARRLGK